MADQKKAADIRELFAASAAAVPTETVEVLGQQVKVRKVSLARVLGIVARFPVLADTLFQATMGDGVENKTVFDVLLSAGPQAVAALIASAIGYEGDAEVEAGLAELPDEAIVALLAATIRTTMPGGAADFFGRLAKAAEASGLFDALGGVPGAAA